MVQAFSPKAADNTLHIAVLPRTTGSDREVLHAETEHALLKMMTIDPVAIPDQKTWRRIPGKSFNNLLRRPNRSWMLCHVKMHDAATIVHEDDKHKQHPKAQGRNGKEVYPNRLSKVLSQERRP